MAQMYSTTGQTRHSTFRGQSKRETWLKNNGGVGNVIFLPNIREIGESRITSFPNGHAYDITVEVEF